MRALWLVASVFGLVVSAGADASGGAAFTRGNVGAPAMHSFRVMSGLNRPGNDGRFGNMRPGERGHGNFNRFPGRSFVYLPAYGQQYADPGNSGPDYDAPAATQIIYVQTQPAPAPVVVIAPPAPAQTVQYATSGQSIAIPTGARVTKGSVYKYTQNGVNTYTNVPPPDGARAKLLFAYTEAISTASAHMLYRCAGDKSGTVGYSQAPLPNHDCKAISYADSSVN
jgi:hypothetical protein